MSLDPETLRAIKEEIKTQMNIILSAPVLNSTSNASDVSGLFPGMDTITSRPVIGPYGFASVAPDNTLALVARQGSHFGNRVVVGYRAGDRPTDLKSGESALYSAKGYSVRVHNGSIELGKSGTWQTVPMGETLRQVLISIIQAIVVHTHEGNLSIPTGPPSNASDFTQIQTQNLDNKKILAIDGGAF